MTTIYHEPASIEDAIRLLRDHGDDARPLAGGTAWTVLWHLGLAAPPQHLVGLRGIDDLRGIRTDGEGLWLGALATHRAVETSPLVRRRHDALAVAFGTIATVRIRNQATLGGNLAHADPAQDPAPVLMALDATAVIQGLGGQREVPIASLFESYLTTTLRSDELIVAVRVPAIAPGTRVTFVKYLPRTADDYATVSVAAAARVVDGRVTSVRIALGAVAPTPVRATSAEAVVTGAYPTAEVLAHAASLVDHHISPAAADGARSRTSGTWRVSG